MVEKKSPISHIRNLKLVGQIVSYLWIQDWKIRLRLLASLFFIGTMIVLSVATPLVLRKIVGLLALPDMTNFKHTITLLLLVYGTLWVLSRIVTELREIVLFRVMERSIRSMSLRLFEHLHDLSIRFHLDRKTGAITNVIERIQKAFPDIIWSLVVMVPTVIEIVVVMAILWYLYGFSYGLILLLVLVISISFSAICLELIDPLQRRHVEMGLKSSSFIVDSLLNFETVKYFGNQKFEVNRCNEILKAREDATTKLYIARGCIGLGQGIILGVGLLIITLKSGLAVIAGHMNLGDFVVINSYMLQFVTPVQYFSYFLRSMSKGLGDMENTINLLHTKPEIVDAPDAPALKLDRTADVTFEHVSFGYNSRGLILKDISFTVPAGKMVAIVGATGSGKSTISRLLFRFYDVNEGRILINGQDIKLVTQESLRKAIGIVPQDTMLFNNTLYYNIAYGRPTATKEEVEQATRLAHLDTFVEKLPQGYDTPVGERGLKLSGGEKQRVAIARAVLKQPKIYIFDEATSALDTVTERQIQRNLEEVAHGSTTLVIAHRLSTVTHADEIIVIENGHIAQRGSHKDLLQDESGLYAHLWKKQVMCPEF